MLGVRFSDKPKFSIENLSGLDLASEIFSLRGVPKISGLFRAALVDGPMALAARCWAEIAADAALDPHGCRNCMKGPDIGYPYPSFTFEAHPKRNNYIKIDWATGENCAKATSQGVPYQLVGPCLNSSDASPAKAAATKVPHTGVSQAELQIAQPGWYCRCPAKSPCKKSFQRQKDISFLRF